jgi:hypothetical protein
MIIGIERARMAFHTFVAWYFIFVLLEVKSIEEENHLNVHEET